MRKAVIGLGLFLVAACGGSSEKDDSESGGPATAGEADSGGGSGKDRGGSTSTGGEAGEAGSSGSNTGGIATGGSSSGGTSTGGSPTGGSDRGGTTQGGASNQGGSGGYAAAQGGGATAGMAGAAAAAGIATAGSSGRSTTGGTGGTSDITPVCDPEDGSELDNTPYPDCRPRDANDRCELCIEANCCEEARVCYGYEPANVCGWGGPTKGTYAGLNEIDCYIACVRDYVEMYGVYDDDADDRCIPMCTSACPLIGNATQDLAVCLQANCEDDCFLP